MRRINEGIEEHQENSKKKKKSFFKKALGFLNRHKFTILLAVGGVAMLVAAPFTGGTSAILYAAGASALLGAVAAEQGGRAARRANKVAEDLSASDDARYILKSLIKDTDRRIVEAKNDLRRVRSHQELLDRDLFINLDSSEEISMGNYFKEKEEKQKKAKKTKKHKHYKAKSKAKVLCFDFKAKSKSKPRPDFDISEEEDVKKGHKHRRSHKM